MINVIFKTTNSCNANCSYCFDKVNQTQLNNFQAASVEQIFKVFEKLCDLNPDGVRWTWHGGEPLLPGYKWYDEVLFGMYEISQERRVPLTFCMQTNGILLTKDFQRLLNKYNVHAAISYDGINNINTRRYSKPDSYNRMKSGIAVINPLNIDTLIEDYKIRKKDNKDFNCNLGYPAYGHTVDEFWGGHNKVLEAIQKYIDYAMYYINDKTGNVHDRQLDDWIRVSLGKETYICTFNNCLNTSIFCITPEGKIYKCDEIEMDQIYLGSVFDYNSMDELYNHSKLRFAQKQYQQIVDTYCKDCDYKNHCAQGCWACKINESNGTRPYSLNCMLAKRLIPMIYDKLNDLSPEEFLELNPMVREVLLKSVYIPSSIKEAVNNEANTNN